MRSRRRSRSSSRTTVRWTLLAGLLAVMAGVGTFYFWRSHRQTRHSAPSTDGSLPLPISRTIPQPPKGTVQQTNALPEGAVVFDTQPYPRPPRSLLEVQIALDRQGISPGSIDGRLGAQTRLAIAAFQRMMKLQPSGMPDGDTRNRLLLQTAPLTVYQVTSNDLARIQPLGRSWTAKSQQSALEFESVLEQVAEESHTHPGCIRSLNPNVDWTNVTVGLTVRLPAVSNDPPSVKAAFVRISIAEKILEGYDKATNLLVHFPCSIAQRVEKRPIGLLRVQTVATHPNYTFDPELFPESPEARQMTGRLVLPPGPNNPVGSVWIGLDKTGYGIHGTPNPEQVGRTESHGCFRLANWNAELLLRYCWIGMPVYVEP